MATALMGLLAMGSGQLAIAHEANQPKEKLYHVEQIAAAMARTLGNSLNHRVLAEAPFEAAIHTLYCLEAREALNTGRLHRQGQQWILIHGHRCQDDRLLFDAFGF